MTNPPSDTPCATQVFSLFWRVIAGGSKPVGLTSAGIPYLTEPLVAV